MKQKKILLLLSVLLGLSACTKKSPKTVDVSQIQVSVTIKHLENELFALKSKQQIREFLQKYPDFTQQFFQISNQLPDSQVVNRLFRIITTPEFRQFESQVAARYADKDLDQAFENAFRHIKYYYPDFKVPKIYTTVCFHRDVVISDSLIVIGLDYFMGEKTRFPPPALTQYMLRRYDKPYIVPMCVLEISSKYNITNPQDKTLLADMVWFGKGLEFTSFALPDTPDSLLIGYSAKQSKEIEANKRTLWSHYVERKLFYDTREDMKRRYVDERPYTAEISLDCPPRTGRWLGWQMVRKYLANTGKTLPELMKNADAQDLFTKSGYKGE